MNPSAAGWINKLLKELYNFNLFLKYSEEEFYITLRHCGFIYGNNLDVVAQSLPKSDLTEEEICKTNLVLALLYAHENSKSKVHFSESVINFYTNINEIKTSLFQDILGGKKSSEQLEKIIQKRVHINDNILTKNFNYFVINALLYVDVLAYAEYLKQQSISKDYLKNIEASIVSITLGVLNSKDIKNQYEDSLIKLFEASLRYSDRSYINYDQALTYLKSPFEKQYILDLACMATWGDRMIDTDEHQFLEKLGLDMGLNLITIHQSIKSVNRFYTINEKSIALLSSSNIVQTFYNNSSKMVFKLITRNSKRLYSEIKESKELMVLISQSTKRELTKAEQKKVQEQLLDIFKSIPSLAIFLLPGGAILLPLVIKFIPNLLPSAFDENRIDD
ncbi:LETM1-related biofilm-associated protein [Tamlana sp. 2_MG-2023]|uniref:LETM1-related biofilm-associated protein n=1 Tax=unclassified Tamlana TaxID=2614803 RepID=UPI0026E25F46|nr:MULTISPECIES: LETM1-related biofilm-associated protein [unclassified Tamlana]MDO6758671.1 LETM1-related biofilm-associated protein [Tamlana sp. 2_MG-2023]MDO6789370.1 LETM1-related biofilm-associated protein [Tamlana sp. 1_MG-2023]